MADLETEYRQRRAVQFEQQRLLSVFKDPHKWRADAMARLGTFLVPTLITYQAIVESGEADGMAPESVAKVGDLVEAGVEALRMADAAGVPVAYGSDLLGSSHPLQARGIALHLRAQTPAAVLAALTVVPARLLRMADEVGVLRPGSVADAVLLTKAAGERVLADPSAIDGGVAAVVQGGRLVHVGGDMGLETMGPPEPSLSPEP